MNPLYSLTGKVAIVTGASRWTGKTIALELARAGADVVVTARTVEGVEATANEVRSLGRRSLAIPGDVRIAEQFTDLVKKTMDEFGRIDILVNNVGASYMAPAIEFTEKAWDSMIRENLKPAFMCSKAVIEAMMQQGRGSIVNIASGEAFRAAPSNVGYGAAKAGIINLTMSLACEWAQYGVRVNAVAPGFIDTPILPEAVSQFAELRATFERVPLKRAGRMEEIAAPVVFLASDAASYITGSTIVVDGGLITRM